MDAEHILGPYEAICRLNEQMLASAQRSDWDGLLELEAHCRVHVQALQDREPVAALTAEDRARKIEIIHRILAYDREIRTITEAWTTRLAALLGHASFQRKLNAAYSPA